MPSIIKNVPVLLGRLLIWRAVFFVAGTVISATLGALSGVDLSAASKQQIAMMVLGILGVTAGTLGAFIDKSAAQIAQGSVPFVDVPLDVPVPGTKIVKQTETKETTTIPPATQ